jgi:transcription elongation factor Elf1
MARKKEYFDKIVNCSVCGKEYTEILSQDDLQNVIAFYCEDCGKDLKKFLEKSGIGIKPPRKRKKSISKS